MGELKEGIGMRQGEQTAMGRTHTENGIGMIDQQSMENRRGWSKETRQTSSSLLDPCGVGAISGEQLRVEGNGRRSRWVETTRREGGTY